MTYNDSEQHRGRHNTEDHHSCGCEVRCGVYKSSRFAVPILNFCNNAKVVLAFLSFAACLQGMLTNGFYSIVVSTLEKRFMLRSSETGFISSAYDIAGFVAIPFVTYIGGRGHKPLWIGSGLLFIGVGSLLFSLPHFVGPTYTINSAEAFVCGNVTEGCHDSVRAYRGIFIIGQMLQGVGAVPLYTLALTYLDENVLQVHSSIFHGIFYACSLLGPGIGYLLGGYFLTFYTNLSETVAITQESPLWIGNWWLGFLIAGIVFIGLAIPIMMYPEQLPGTEKVRLDRESEMHQSEEAKLAKQDQNFGMSVRDFPRCLLLILKNPTLMFISMAGAMDSGMMIGIATFGPKYIESVFRLSASSAAFYFGVLAIATASSAHLIAGLVVSKLKLTINQMMRMCIVSGVIAFSSYFIFLQSCRNANIAGITVPYTLGQDRMCAKSECGCSVDFYNPICGSDDVTYMSYCDAGCNLINSTHFSNCSRIPGISTASKGTCDVEDCPHLNLFLIFMAVAVFFTFLKGQPSLQASLRSVPFAQRSFTLGIQWLIIRLFGSIPMPIIYGKVLDISCLAWKMECGECGSCHVYNNDSMSLHMTVLTVILKGISVLLFILALRTYMPPDTSEENEPLERTFDVDKRHYATDQPQDTTPDGDKMMDAKSTRPLPLESNAFDNATFTL